MPSTQEPDDDTGGTPLLAIGAAVVVAGAAVTGLFLLSEGESTTPHRAAQGAVTEQTTPSARPVAAVDPRDEIPTMLGLPGFGVFDGSVYPTSKKAKALADQHSTAELLAGLQTSAATSTADSKTDYVQALGLKSANADIVQALAPFASSNDIDLRRGALAGLMGSGPEGIAALSQALATMTSGGNNPAAETDVIAALGQIGPEAESAIGALIGTLESGQNVEVRKMAAQALGNLGANAAPELQNISKALDNQSLPELQLNDLKQQVQRSLQRIKRIEAVHQE